MTEVFNFTASLREWFALLTLRDGDDTAKRLFEAYRDSFALAIQDYLILASFGEARHQARSAGVLSNWCVDGDRFDAYDTACEFSPEKSLSNLRDFFQQYQWSSAFGGDLWCAAVVLAQQFRSGAINAETLIDSAVGLEHHTGCLFNKGAIFGFTDAQGVRTLLNAWSRVETPTLIGHHEVLSALAERQGLPFKLHTREHTPLDGYTAVSWGDRELDTPTPRNTAEKCPICRRWASLTKGVCASCRKGMPTCTICRNPYPRIRMFKLRNEVYACVQCITQRCPACNAAVDVRETKPYVESGKLFWYCEACRPKTMRVNLSNTRLRSRGEDYGS